MSSIPPDETPSARPVPDTIALDLMPGSFAICRLDAAAAVPPWAMRLGFSSITRTSNELSIVCGVDDVPDAVRAQRGYRGLVVRGPLDFDLVGIVASLAGALSAAAISIFVVSTYDTDYLFVREADLDRAVAVLRAAGNSVTVTRERPIDGAGATGRSPS